MVTYVSTVYLLLCYCLLTYFVAVKFVTWHTMLTKPITSVIVNIQVQAGV